MKVWRYFPGDCHYCGSDLEIFTDEKLEEGECFDSDRIRCSECGEKGQIDVFDMEDVSIHWHGED